MSIEMVAREEIKARADKLMAEQRAKDRAEQALQNLKTRGYEDSKNIAIVLEYIMNRL